MNNFKILISSCDNYSYLWDVLKFSHENYLGKDYKDITTLISETKQSDYFHTINYQGRWKDMLLAFLKDTKEEYILYIQDDYMFYKQPIPLQYFEDMITMCKEKSIDHLLLTNKADLYAPTFKEKNKWGELYLREFYGDYLASLQMGIWRREYFIKLLESFHFNSIWEFEINGNIYCRNLNAKTYLFYNIENNIGRVFEPSEIVRKGQVLPVIKEGGLIREKWITDFPDKIEEIKKLTEEL
jgi:hypothetical protein